MPLTDTACKNAKCPEDILGRILNFGTLVISGAGNPQALIPGISNPMTFRRSLMEYQDSVRKT